MVPVIRMSLYNLLNQNEPPKLAKKQATQIARDLRESTVIPL